MDIESRAYLSLSLTEGVGARIIRTIVEHIKLASHLHSLRHQDLLALPGIGKATATAVIAMRDSDEPEKEMQRAKCLGVALITPNQSHYPEALRHTYSPPAVLYVKGELPLALQTSFEKMRSVAIVGTRRASDYGLSMGFRLAKDLADAGIVIVSGLAYGVDAQAHRGALKAGTGTTLAVLGSSLDHVYPAKHQPLAETISQQAGAVISEYRLGTRPRAGYFPARNRIIAGLARAVLVIEAGERSGALITADMALEEGRTVFAIPGRVGDARARGSNNLLRQGATLVESAEDILEEFRWQQPSRLEMPALQLTAMQASVLNHVRGQGAPLLDDLVADLALQAAEVQSVLTMLELKQLVKAVPGGRYVCLPGV